MTTSAFFMVLLLQAAASLAAVLTVRRSGNIPLVGVYVWSVFANVAVPFLPDTWTASACVAYEFASCTLIVLAVIGATLPTFDWSRAGWLSLPVIVAGPIALLVLERPPCESDLLIVPLTGLAAIVCSVGLRDPWLGGITRTATVWLGWACVTRAVVALAPQAVVSDWQHVATMVWVVGCAAVAWRGWRAQ